MTHSHESFEERRPTRRSSDRDFGLTVGAVLVGIGIVRSVWRHPSPHSTAAIVGVGCVLILVAFTRPTALATLNQAWAYLGEAIANIVNPLVMLLIFTTVFVPIALAMRLRGRDVLGLRSGTPRVSYWIDRAPPGPPAGGMVNQY